VTARFSSKRKIVSVITIVSSLIGLILLVSYLPNKTQKQRPASITNKVQNLTVPMNKTNRTSKNVELLVKLTRLAVEDSLNYDFSGLVRESHCLDRNTFNYTCFLDYLVNKKGVSYKEYSIDFIKAVPYFVKSRGGDCEDWAMFGFALTVYLRRKNVTYFQLNNKTVNLQKYSYSFEVCYKITNTTGHCIDALCRDSELRDCIFFEPQNGNVIGNTSFLDKVRLIIGENRIIVRKST